MLPIVCLDPLKLVSVCIIWRNDFSLSHWSSLFSFILLCLFLVHRMSSFSWVTLTHPFVHSLPDSESSTDSSDDRQLYWRWWKGTRGWKERSKRSKWTHPMIIRFSLTSHLSSQHSNILFESFSHSHVILPLKTSTSFLYSIESKGEGWRVWSLLIK